MSYFLPLKGRFNAGEQLFHQSAITLHQIDGEPFRTRQGRVHRVRAAKRGISALLLQKSKRTPENWSWAALYLYGRRAGGVVTRSARSCFSKTSSHHARFPWFDACQIGQEQNLQVEETTKKVFPVWQFDFSNSSSLQTQSKKGSKNIFTTSHLHCDTRDTADGPAYTLAHERF